MSLSPLYITTPIYYVNDKPHIGSAYTTLVCDIIARFHKLQGTEVYFLTGTDEHGQKIQKAAEKAQKKPQEFVDEMHKPFHDLLTILDIQCDDFIRTTEARHQIAAQHFFDKLKDFIYLGAYEGWYAIRDEAFYGEDELVDGKAPTGADVEWVSEPSYFFKLSAFQEPLLAFYQNNPDFIAPNSRFNEVKRFVEGGLNDLSISRTTFTWGIPVPHDPQHILYVWLDALTNYITALGYPDETNPLFQKFWPHAVHMVGKDILRFHGVYWPAFLMAAGLPLPRQIFAHGWWTNEGVKISKSLGNTIDPVELVETFGSDGVRYFLSREMSLGQDGDFSRQALVNRLNADLANTYGNLVQRVLAFIFKNQLTLTPPPLIQDDQNFLKGPVDFSQTADIFKLQRYGESVMALIAKGNTYMDQHKPWVLKKEDPLNMHHVLYVLCDYIRRLAILTQPLLPKASCHILDTLNVEKRLFSDIDTPLEMVTLVTEPVGIFPRWV